MLKKLTILTIMLLASNFTVASQTPDQEEPAAKRAKIDRGTATTSIAAAPAVASASRRSEYLDAVTTGQYSLQDIILGYLDNDEWVEVKTVAVNGVDPALRVHQILYSPDGKQIAFNASSVRQFLYALKTLHVLSGQIQTLHEDNQRVVWLGKYSPHGKYLAVGADNDMIIINGVTGNRLNKLKQYSLKYSPIAWSPDEKQLAFSAPDKILRIWDAENGSIIRTFTTRDSLVTSVSWSQCGTRLAAGRNNGIVEVWEPSTGEIIHRFDWVHRNWGGKHPPSTINSVAWSPNGKKLASGSFKEIHIWDVEARTGKKLWTRHANFSLAWSPNSKYIAAGESPANGQYGDKNINIWDVATGECIKTLEGFESPTFSPCGNYLAGSDGENIKIWYKNQAQAMASVVQKVEHVQSAPSVCRGAAACTIM